MAERAADRGDGGSSLLPPWLDSGSEHLLAGYLAVIGANYDDRIVPRLLRGQFHDVVLLGEVAYRFPRDENSRRLLPARIELLRVLGQYELPVTIPALLSAAAVREPLGRCHAALQRVSGQPVGPELLGSESAESAAATDLATFLDCLLELGKLAAIRQAVPQAAPNHWQLFGDDVRHVLFPLMSDDGRARADAELTGVLAVDPAGDALVHSDLGGTNLLWTIFDSGPRLAGVLDWDEACIGSQANDLASIAATFGWPLVIQIDALRHGGRTPLVAGAAAVAATFALQQALPAALSGDIAALDDGLSRYR